MNFDWFETYNPKNWNMYWKSIRLSTAMIGASDGTLWKNSITLLSTSICYTDWFGIKEQLDEPNFDYSNSELTSEISLTKMIELPITTRTTTTNIQIKVLMAYEQLRCKIVWKHTFSYNSFKFVSNSWKIFWCFKSADSRFDKPKSHEQNNLWARNDCPPDVAMKLFRYDSAVLVCEI